LQGFADKSDTIHTNIQISVPK